MKDREVRVTDHGLNSRTWSPKFPGRICVLYGGISEERQVSIASGEAVCEALEGAGYEVIRGCVGQDVALFIGSLRADVAFIALHGALGEDGRVQRLLGARGLPYIGSGPQASLRAFDKARAKRIFKRRGVPTPEWMEVHRYGFSASAVELFLGLPLVVKPNMSGSSIGITIVRDGGALAEATARAFEYDDTVLLERFVAGKELTVGMLGREALPVIELATPREFYDYEAKYFDRGTTYICPAELDAAVEARVTECARTAFNSLGCRDFGRVDIILSEEGTPFVLEVNTIPGLTSHSLLPKAARAAGMSFLQMCEELLDSAITSAAA